MAEQPLEAVPLTSYTGREEHPTFSPDGARVAFSWNGESQDNFDIYVKEIDSDNRQRLTTDPVEDVFPAWSPDGRFIAFLRLDPSEDKFKVVIIPSIGGPERVVGDFQSALALRASLAPAWTPDSMQLVVVDRSSPDDATALFLLSIDTGKKRRLTSPPAGPFGDDSPTFSLDGHTLAFTRWTSLFFSDIFLLPLTADWSPDGKPERLSPEGQSIRGLNWSADGEEIVYSAGLGSLARLWKIPISSGGTQEAVAAAGGSAFSPAVSRQGSRLAYERRIFDPNVWAIRVGHGDNAAGSAARVIASTRRDTAAQYSPDGKRIVFESDRTGVHGIWLSDADGSNAKPLFLHPDGSFAGSPRWSPDGRHIVFDAYSEGNADLFVISASGGEPFRLTTHPADDQVPSWSGDGAWVYFGSTRTGRREVWKMPAGGGEPAQVTKEGGFIALESPDGRFIYYTKEFAQTTSLWKLPVEGGEESKVLDSVHHRNFAIVPEGVYFVAVPAPAEPDRAYSIRFLDFAGRAELVYRLPSNIVRSLGLSVSPDGQSILYTQVDDISSDLMLIEGFE